MSLHAVDDLTLQTAYVGVSDHNLRVANYVWDTDTLAWIRQSAGAGGGPSSNVSVISTVGLTDTQLRASAVKTTGANYAQQVDDQTSYMYIGKAATGSTLSSSVWSIKKVTFAGAAIETTWAGGSDTFTNNWNNRAALSYS